MTYGVCRKVASLRDATSQCWLVGPLSRADLAAFLLSVQVEYVGQ